MLCTPTNLNQKCSAIAGIRPVAVELMVKRIQLTLCK
jgi:hypothetical protein